MAGSSSKTGDRRKKPLSRCTPLKMKDVRRTFYTVAKRALGHLLPPARATHARLGRWIRRIELERERLPYPWAERQVPKRWRHLAEPSALSIEAAQAFSPDDPGPVLERTRMLDGQGHRWIRNPFTIFNWEGYRRAMEAVGVSLPEREPRRELSPVATAPLECRFDFEMPEAFGVPRRGPGGEEPFEIELAEDGST